MNRKPTPRKSKYATGIINYQHEQKRAKDYFAEVHQAIVEADSEAEVRRDLTFQFSEAVSDLRAAMEDIITLAESGELELECFPIVIKLFAKLGSIKPVAGVFN
jgi:hypothetical protein